MAMEVSGTYGGYSNSYAAISNKRKTETSKEDVKGKNEVSSESKEVRKTASDELAYLSKKYDGFSFVAADFKPGMKYGSLSTTNIAISPTFLQKMANDPKLEAEYEKEFANMKRLDEEELMMHKAAGTRLIARGWAIDKNGDMCKWGVGEATNKRHYGQEMTDYANKIRQEKADKKKKQSKIEEKKTIEKKKKEAIEKKAKENNNTKVNNDLDSENNIKIRDDNSETENLAHKSEDIIKKLDDKNVVGINLDLKL